MILKAIYSLVFFFLFSIPIFLIFLPANYLDDKSSYCISKFLFNMKCLGCGMSKAILHAIHFNFYQAWTWNPLFVIIFPALIYIYFLLLKHCYQKSFLFKPR